MQLTKNFHSSEFACKCGCNSGSISKILVDKLQIARIESGIGYQITSGLRCPTHNKREGGLSSSAHLSGLAVDIATPDSNTRIKVLTGLIHAGFHRIGFAKSFIHADIDKSKPFPTCWIY
jgi:uncharacterized protein YcbK (DUF882 family)